MTWQFILAAVLWDPWQTSSEEKTLDHCRNSWSVRQKERTEKEKIWDWRIWEIQGSEQQPQEVLEKGKRKNWIGEQRSEIEENLRKNNSKRVYQLVKDLTTVKQGKATTVQDRSGKCLTEERQILNRILLWAVQPQGQWRSVSTELSPDRHRGRPPHPLQRSGGCSKGSQLELTTSQQNWSKKMERT